MNIVDIVLLALFAVTVITSAVRGFAKSASGIIAWILAGALSIGFCAQVSDFLYETLFRETVTENIEERITVPGEAEEIAVTASQILDEMPEFIISAAEAVGIDTDRLKEKTESFSADSGEIAVSLEENTVGPIIRAALKAICFVLMLIIISAILRFIMMPITKLIEKLPIVKQTNRILGGVLGILKAAVMTVVLSMLLALFAGFSQNEFSQTADQSLIVNAVTESKIAETLFI